MSVYFERNRVGLAGNYFSVRMSSSQSSSRQTSPSPAKNLPWYKKCFCCKKCNSSCCKWYRANKKLCIGILVAIAIIIISLFVEDEETTTHSGAQTNIAESTTVESELNAQEQPVDNANSNSDSAGTTETPNPPTDNTTPTSA